MSEGLILVLDHATVWAPLDRREDARWFYGSVLGLPEAPRGSGVLDDSGPLWFALGDGHYLLVTFEPVPLGAAAGSLALRVSAVSTVADALRANGLDAHVGSVTDGNCRRCFCRDPFGNRLEFVEYLSAEGRGAA